MAFQKSSAADILYAEKSTKWNDLEIDRDMFDIQKGNGTQLLAHVLELIKCAKQ